MVPMIVYLTEFKEADISRYFSRDTYRDILFYNHVFN